MALTVHAEEDTQRQLKLTIAVSEDQVQRAMRQAAAKLAHEVEFPGFRRGKVPYPILLRRVGATTLRVEAVEEMFPELLTEALKEWENELYGEPHLDDMELDPLVIKVTMPLQPKVTLGDYRALRKEITPVEVTEEAVDHALEHIRERHQIVEPVERPAEAGDLITIKGKARILAEEEEVIFDRERADLILEADDLVFGPEFVNNVVGLAAGEQKTFRFTMPEPEPDEEKEEEEVEAEAAEVAGEEGGVESPAAEPEATEPEVVEFDLTILAVKRRELPELNDELAQTEGDYDTLDELRQAVREALQKEAEQNARTALIEETIDELVAGAAIVHPPAAQEAELDSMVEELQERAESMGWQWNDYLKLQEQTEESLRQTWHETAENRLRRKLALREFVLQEKLSVSEAEVERTLAERVENMPDGMRQPLQEILSQGDSLNFLANNILLDKIHDRMAAILSGNAPDVADLDASDTIMEEE